MILLSFISTATQYLQDKVQRSHLTYPWRDGTLRVNYFFLFIWLESFGTYLKLGRTNFYCLIFSTNNFNLHNQLNMTMG